MSATQTICAVCAWRETCKKKFSVSGKDLRCAEFVKDVSIREEPSEEAKKKERK